MKAKPLDEPFRYRDFDTALAALKKGLKKRTYALLTGDSGTGKTTLLRTLARELDTSRFQLVYLCHGRPSPSALARVLAEALHLPLQRTRAETSRLLMANLKTMPTHLLVWLDETQLISEDTLHEIRLLAEADLDGPPLFSVILTALPQLKEKLLAPALFPLWRRISIKATLNGLAREELEAFLRHTLGPKAPERFSPPARDALFEHGRGIPALLVQLAEACIAAHAKTVSVEMLAQTLERIEMP